MARRGTTRPWSNAAGQTISIEARWYDDTNNRRSKRFRVEQPGNERSERRAQASAEAELDRISADKQRGDYLDPRAGKTRFADVAEEWLAMKMNRTSTVQGYESLLRRHVLPCFGSRPVGSIRTSDVRRFLALTQRGGAAPGTVRNAYRVLKAVLDAAVDDDLIRSNPCVALRRDDFPKSRRTTMLFLDAEQVARLADAIREPHGPLIYFAAYTGLRAGEIGALRMANVDLLHGVVRVTESLSAVKGDWDFVPPKTNQERSVRLPAFLVSMLREYLATQPAKGPRDFLFTGPNGGHLKHGIWYQRRFRPAVARAELPPGLRFHDLRHTCAALMIADNAPPKLICDRLGHSTIQVTMDRYGHLLPSVEEAAIAGLDKTYFAAQTARALKVVKEG